MNATRKGRAQTRGDGVSDLKQTTEAAEKFRAESFLRGLTSKPGVYCMFANKRRALYVGKAKNLKKRVSSYFRKHESRPRVLMLLERLETIETTITDSEWEALILECNLIKKLKPRYNVILRDDKSYPYIRVSADNDFPRVSFFRRGSRKTCGQFFGPYPNSQAVRETLKLIYKIFRLRQCDDSVFKSRSRPCLQYQIQRCSAPCVGLVSKDEYRADLVSATDFLAGNNKELMESLLEKMDKYAARLQFEKAVKIRNQIEMLRAVTEQKGLSLQSKNLDVIAIKSDFGLACIQVFQIRGGLNIGNRAYYPDIPKGGAKDEAIIKAFVVRRYLLHEPPNELVVSAQPEDLAVVKAMLAKIAKRKVLVSIRVRGEKRKLLELARKNAEYSLEARISNNENCLKQRAALEKIFFIKETLKRVECFDISHTMGEATVASCVVWDEDGFNSKLFRCFNIKNITPGDDCAAISQALTRHYRRLASNRDALPQLLIIDGGKGQLRHAAKTLKKLDLSALAIIGVAKGKQRAAGEETIYLYENGDTRAISVPTFALRLILRIRDAAHDFAIAGHRRRLRRQRQTSPLESINGLGPKRRLKLIKHFGGLRGLSSASSAAICEVKGIGVILAKEIKTAMQL